MGKFKNQEHSFLLKSHRNTTMFSKMQKYALVGRILLTGLANFLNPLFIIFFFFSWLISSTIQELLMNYVHTREILKIR